MKKRLIPLILAAIMILMLIPFSGSAAWNGVATLEPLGDGSRENPYKICTENEFAGFAKMVNADVDFKDKYVVLDADIDLDNQLWTPIGVAKDYAFNGHFDGQGHTVKNVKVEVTTDYGGLFGFVVDGTIENLYVENISVTSNKYAAGVASNLQVTPGTGYSCIRNVHVNAAKLCSDQCGGIVGRISTKSATTDQMLIEYCSTTGVVIERVKAASDAASSNFFFGGIVGAAGAVKIRYCWSENFEGTCGGNVTGYCCVAGICGIQGADSVGADIENCYAINVSGKLDESTTLGSEKIAFGGIIGRAGNTNTNCEAQNCFAIKTSFNTAALTDCSGGVFGQVAKAILFNNCFTDAEAGVGADLSWMDYPVKAKINAADLSTSGAVDTFKLNQGSTKAVWTYDSYAGHPVIDQAQIADNVFTAADYIDLIEETTAEETTSWPTLPPDVTAAPPAETKAPQTEAPVTEAPVAETEAPADVVTEAPAPVTEAPAAKSGCASSAFCGFAVIAVIGSAYIAKKKH